MIANPNLMSNSQETTPRKIFEESFLGSIYLEMVFLSYDRIDMNFMSTASRELPVFLIKDQEKEFRPRSEGPVTPYGSGPFLNREAGLNYQEDRDAEGGGLVFWFFMEGN